MLMSSVSMCLTIDVCLAIGVIGGSFGWTLFAIIWGDSLRDSETFVQLVAHTSTFHSTLLSAG
jgi:hypothetical protein